MNEELRRDEHRGLPKRRIGVGLQTDLVFALRRLRKSPLFVSFAVFTLALGIGVTSAVYSVLHRVLWRPLGVQDENTVISLERKGIKGPRRIPVRELVELGTHQRTLESIEFAGRFTAALSGAGRPTIVAVEAVSGGYFNTLGVRVRLGRSLQPFDDQPGANPVVVIGEYLWRTNFAADEQILGRIVKLADRPFEVVGIVDARFEGTIQFPADTSVWLPLSAAGSVSSRFQDLWTDSNRRRTTPLQPFGRLKPGASKEIAAADFERIGHIVDALYPLTTDVGRERVPAPREWTAGLLGVRMDPTEFELTRIVLLVPAIVLIIACTNLTNLVLSRGTSRLHEFAVRRALGGSRWRVVREQLVEVAFIAVMGAVLGLAVARLLRRQAQAFMAGGVGFLPGVRLDVGLEPGILGVVTTTALLALLVGGLAPALELTRLGSSRRLAVDSPGLAAPRWRGRRNLIALQVGASVGLFLFAAFLIQQITASEPAKSGMDLDRAAIVSLSLSSHQKDTAEGRRIVDAALRHARTMPGIDVVAAGAMWNHWFRSVRLRVAQADGRMRPGAIAVMAVTGEMFEALALPVVAGRTFDARDESGPLAVIINRSLSMAVFGTMRVDGRQLQYQMLSDHPGVIVDTRMQAATVVGVAADTYARNGAVRPTVYMPLARREEPDVEFFSRSTSLTNKDLVTAIRTAITRVDPQLAVSFAGSARVLHDGGVMDVLARITAVAVSLATFALVVSMAGLYGVLSHIIEQRTKEMGIRAALGADRTRIRNLVLKEGLRPVLEGGIIGLGAASFLTMVAQPWFSKEVPALAVESVLTAVVPLCVAGAIACYLPARRASQLDPAVCLRDE